MVPTGVGTAMKAAGREDRQGAGELLVIPVGSSRGQLGEGVWGRGLGWRYKVGGTPASWGLKPQHWMRLLEQGI